jgi:hypothetical protein
MCQIVSFAVVSPALIRIAYVETGALAIQPRASIGNSAAADSPRSLKPF